MDITIAPTIIEDITPSCDGSIIELDVEIINSILLGNQHALELYLSRSHVNICYYLDRVRNISGVILFQTIPRGKPVREVIALTADKIKGLALKSEHPAYLHHISHHVKSICRRNMYINPEHKQTRTIFWK